MKLNNEDKIAILTIHKNNLLKATNYEDYRDAHVAYIDMLIGQLEAEDKWMEATADFINKVDKDNT